MSATSDDKEEPIELQTTYVLEEGRMVVPGVQTLFGFQLIVVFNAGFALYLSRAERITHLAALVLVAIAMTLLMAPAAYHRQVLPRTLTARFVDISTKLLAVSFAPLAAGIVLDTYLIARVILDSSAQAVLVATFLGWVLAVAWFVWPQLAKARRE